MLQNHEEWSMGRFCKIFFMQKFYKIRIVPRHQLRTWTKVSYTPVTNSNSTRTNFLQCTNSSATIWALTDTKKLINYYVYRNWQKYNGFEQIQQSQNSQFPISRITNRLTCLHIFVISFFLSFTIKKILILIRTSNPITCISQDLIWGTRFVVYNSTLVQLLHYNKRNLEYKFH